MSRFFVDGFWKALFINHMDSKKPKHLRISQLSTPSHNPLPNLLTKN